MIPFENFNEIHETCNQYGIKNYTVNTDGSIDVDDDVDLFDKKLTKIPVKFRNVSGFFSCSSNKLTTLEGAPKSVGENFWCSNNKLTTLEGAPLRVYGDFHCDYNNLTTLVGAPQSVDGSFGCDNNELTTLEGAPKSVGGNFDCSYNNLTTLESAPKSVSGWFYCESNPFEVIRRMFLTGKEFFNANIEWEFFAGGNKIRKLRFKEALLDYDIKLPRSIEGYKYV